MVSAPTTSKVQHHAPLCQILMPWQQMRCAGGSRREEQVAGERCIGSVYIGDKGVIVVHTAMYIGDKG